jgi:hypothetical protein
MITSLHHRTALRGIGALAAAACSVGLAAACSSHSPPTTTTAAAASHRASGGAATTAVQPAAATAPPDSGTVMPGTPRCHTSQLAAAFTAPAPRRCTRVSRWC